GALTGLSPGPHVNNVAALVLATQAAWTGFLAALVPSLLRAGDDRPLALVFPPRDGREPRGLRLHSGRLLGRADGRHGARHAPRAPSPPGGPGRESGGLRRSRGTVGNRLRGGRAGPAPLAPRRPDRSRGPLPTVDADLPGVRSGRGPRVRTARTRTRPPSAARGLGPGLGGRSRDRGPPRAIARRSGCGPVP